MFSLVTIWYQAELQYYRIVSIKKGSFWRLLSIRQGCNYSLSSQTAKPRKYNYPNLCSLECEERSHKLNIVFIPLLLAVIKMHQWLPDSSLWSIPGWNSFLALISCLFTKLFPPLPIPEAPSHKKEFSLPLAKDPPPLVGEFFAAKVGKFQIPWSCCWSCSFHAQNKHLWQLDEL